MSKGFETITLRVHQIRWEADGVLSFDLRDPAGGQLPRFDAGAHVDLVLPNGLTRSYSLCNASEERYRYVIGVNRDANSRGGSIWLHDVLRAGQFLEVSLPQNNFPLNDGARKSVLIAGGIGITPMLSMIRTLTSLKKDWQLHYAVRTSARAAFLDELLRLAEDDPQRLRLHVDDEHAGDVLDLTQIASEADDDTHLYCCGPTMMLEAFEKATAHIPADRIHLEYFSAKGPLAPQGGYTVELARSGLVLTVRAGATILDALLEAGIEVPFSCSEGICGTCRTGVLSGTPRHRDVVLSNAERAANQEMMICCSGSEGDRLVLDL